MEQHGEKTHDPTPHRRQQAREKGDVVRSQDLASAIVLLGGLLALWGLGPGLLEFVGGFTRDHLGGHPWLSADASFITVQWHAGLARTAAVLPLLALIMLVGVAAQLAQIGVMFVPERIMPDLKRIDPIRGLQRIFSLSGLVRLAFGLFKLVVIAAVAYASLAGKIDEIVALAACDLPDVAVGILSLLFWTAVKIGAALLLLALFDYGFQWWKHEQDLRMTTQEVREEMKNLQGDPQVIARRRQVQRQLVVNRLASVVPKADVVVTNPTELAVALKYEVDTMDAPIVIAKGAGVLAQRIRRLALENGIPVIEKKPLAQALYKEVDVNRPIPHKMYAAVAEVLAYVYQLKGKTLPPAGGQSARAA